MPKSKYKFAPKQVEFSCVDGETLLGRFDGGDISGFGGAVILRELEKLHGLIAGAAACIKDTRDPSRVVHTMFNILVQRIFLICLGFPHAIDSNRFGKDAIIKLIQGILPSYYIDRYASQSTVTRLESGRKKSRKQIKLEKKERMKTGNKSEPAPKEKGVTESDIRRLFVGSKKSANDKRTAGIKRHKKPPKMIVLDFDGSEMEAHGHQQYIAFNGHYQVNMYFPLFVFDQNGWLLAPILRPGNQSESEIAVPVLTLLVKRLRKAWPGVSIVFRADAGFHSQKIFRFCEENAVHYVIGLHGDNNLNSRSKDTDQKAEKRFNKEFGEIRYPGKDGAKKKEDDLKKAHALPKKQRREKLEEINSREFGSSAAFGIWQIPLPILIHGTKNVS